MIIVDIIMNIFECQLIDDMLGEHEVLLPQDQGLTSAWDDHLSYLLTPALAAYETERVTGQ